MTYTKLTDEELIDLLFSDEDRLPREVVDELVRRGEKIWPLLADIVCEQMSWQRDEQEQWVAIHATYLLGVIGGEKVVVPLIRASRWAVAYSCDWVTEELPSIFGCIGKDAISLLKVVSSDPTSDYLTRTIAMEGLAAITLKNPEIENEVFSHIGSIFKRKGEDLEVRQHSGNILLDFLRGEFKEELLQFGREEVKRRKKDEDFIGMFSDADVEEVFNKGKKELWSYNNDWLSFYDPIEIKERQQRWKEEKKEGRGGEEKYRSVFLDKEIPVEKKVGRNDPCPCGSGLKYKECCMEDDTLH